MFENHDITRFERTKNKWDGRGEQIIAMIVFRFEATASNFDESNHDSLERAYFETGDRRLIILKHYK